MKATRRSTVQLGGMDDRLVPEPNTARLVSDMMWNPEGYWETCWGAVEVTAHTPGSGAISAVHWFQPRPNQRFLVTERRIDSTTSRIAYMASDGTPTTIVDRRRLDSNDFGTQFLDQGRWLWMLSPIDRLRRWDGQRLVDVGWDGPAPTPVPFSDFTHVDNAAQDLVTPDAYTESSQRGLGRLPVSPDVVSKWLYGYAATYINDLGQESPVSAISFIAGTNITGPSASTIGRTGVRLGMPLGPDNAAAVRIWRTRNLDGVNNPDQGVALYLLATFTTRLYFDYLDFSSDEELGELLIRDDLGAVPRGARCMASWAGSTWLGGTPELGHLVYYSTAGFPEQFGALNVVPVGSAATGPVLALHPIPRGLLAFKAGSVHIIKGNHVDGFFAEVVDESKGTISHRAVVTVGRKGTLFLDPANGPQAVIGTLNDDQPTVVAPAGSGIMKLWRRRVGGLLQAAVACYNPEREEVWWHVPEGGNVRPTLGLVLSVGDEWRWSVREDWDIGAMTYYRSRLWLGSHDDTNAPGVFLFTAGSRKRFDTGSDIAGAYTTNPLANGANDLWRFQWLEAVGLAVGEPTISVTTRSDRKTEQVQQTETGAQQKHHSHERDVWGVQAAGKDFGRGTGLWASGSNQPTYTDYEVARIPISVRLEQAHEHQLRLNSSRLRLAHIDLVVEGGPYAEGRPRERRP